MGTTRASEPNHRELIEVEGAGGFRNGTWHPFVAEARGDWPWRIVGSGGNATADPSFISISVQFR